MAQNASDQPQTTVDPNHLRALAVTHAEHVHTAAELRRAADEIERLREQLAQVDQTTEEVCGIGHINDAQQAIEKALGNAR